MNCGGVGHCLAVRYYSTYSALESGVATRQVVLPRALSSCNEGAPNIFRAAADLSVIDIGFQYSSACFLYRQARGTLRDFDSATWAPWLTPSIDAGLFEAGAAPSGDLGDRDGNPYEGAYHRLYEAQVAAASAWRAFLLTSNGVTALAIHTHGGSRGFSHPTFTPLRLPNGEPGVVVTQFVTATGAAPGESGELVYYRPHVPPPPPPEGDPTIAAAGDISCASDSCHDDETSDLMVADTPTRVLTLGDNQYQRGEYANFMAYYEPDWGRVKSITMPSPGNHDPPSSGYSQYFGKPANYSYELGTWHLISLDSTDVQAATAFLESDLAGRSNACILAYWHHPRFSSGSTHGNNTAMDPLWDRLYAAEADVVLNGHDHGYERFAPQTPGAVPSAAGIREFVVGTGGAALYSFGTVRANSEVRFSGRFGVLRMTLHPTSYEWRFEGEDGVTYDSGSTGCS